jgi:hypothetical protein
MLPTTLILAGMLILVMDILAIASVLMGIHGVMPKLIWIALIVLLPIVGVAMYFLIDQSPADAYARLE